MKLNKFLTVLVALLTLCGMQAKAEDHVSIQGAEIAAGAEFNLDIELVNELEYKAFQMDIVLPEGITPVLNKKGKIVPVKSDRMEDSHSFSYNYIETDRTIKLVCTSMAGDTFYDNEGTLFTIQLKAADGLQGGAYQVKLTGIKFTTEDNIGHEFADATATFTVPGGSEPPVVEKYTYQFVADGVVLASGALAVGAELTAPVAEKEGYTFKGWNPAFTGIMPANDVVYQAVFEENAPVIPAEDHVSIQSADITAGAEFDLPIELVNAVEYKAFQMDIVLPEGITPVLNEKGKIVPVKSDRMEDSHSFSYNYIEAERTVKLVCTSMAGDTFWENSGTLFTIQLKAAANMQSGDYQVQLTGIKFTTEDNIGHVFADATATFAVTAIPVVKYTYQFVSDGNVLSSGELAEGDSLAAPTAEKIGYTFKGWDPAFTGTMPAENVTYKAQWTVNQYTMTFVLGNGENDVVKNLDYGTAIEAPVPAKLGHTFIGWNPVVPATVPADSMTFTAQWKRNSYKFAVTIDGVAVSTDSVLYGDTLKVPANPTKEGYTFTGWDPVIPTVMPANDLEVKAVFEINLYWVTFIAEGDTISKTKKEFGAAIVAPEAPAKDGKRFMMWAPALDATVPTHDVTYEAVYALVVIEKVEVHDTITVYVRDTVQVSTLQRVDAPFIDVDKDGKIVLSCVQENAQIYYTIDGTDPTEASTLYTAPFEVENMTEIRAIAVLRSEVAKVVKNDIRQYSVDPAKGKVYNLQGKQVNKVSRGVFIQNGKKVVVK